MFLSFELSMPGNNAWNGRWTGDGKLYAVVKRFSQMPEVDGKALAGGRFSYSFGDGWVAAITVREVTSSAAAKIRNDSLGFCGYEWMILSILKYGKILSESPDKTAQDKRDSCAGTGNG
jgi:hypothetical protein